MAQLFPYLLFLACPISMGVMMWVMMRGDHSRMGAPPAKDQMTPSPSEERIAELESQVAELRAESVRKASRVPVGEHPSQPTR